MTDVLDVVEHVLGIEGRLRGDEYDFSCPVHADRHPSAGINIESGLWHCMGCGAGGDLANLAMAVRRVDRKSALRLVEPHTPEALLSTLKKNINTLLMRRSTKARISLPAKYPLGPLVYLKQRGFDGDILRLYEAGYVEREILQSSQGGTYSIRDYVALPIRDRAGHLLAWCYRATAGGPRYLYTPGASIANMWFGIHLWKDARSIVVTEGALDSMWVAQVGFPAYGLLGASMITDLKLQQLLRHERVILMMDRDRAGARATKMIGDRLGHRMPVLVARYPSNLPKEVDDPAKLTPGDVSRMISRAVPYQRWMGGVTYSKVRNTA